MTMTTTPERAVNQAPAPAPAPATTPKPAQTEPDSSTARTGREMLAAAISVVILGVAMWAFIATFNAGREPFAEADMAKENAYERQKDLLTLAVGLLGTVTGYYFGRVPAELRAQTAQGLLTDATTATNQANQNTETVKREARQKANAALEALQAQAGASSRQRSPLAGAGADEPRADLDEARRQLELLRNL